MSSTSKKPSKSKASTTTASRKAAPKATRKKAAAPKSSAAKAVKAPTKAKRDTTPAPKVAAPTVVNRPQPVVLGPAMRKRELIEAVVTRTGTKKKDAKPVVEGMLAVLGEALAEGRELILPPMGKFAVRKEKKLPKGKMMVVKVRQRTAPVPEEDVGS